MDKKALDDVSRSSIALWEGWLGIYNFRLITPGHLYYKLPTMETTCKVSPLGRKYKLTRG